MPSQAALSRIFVFTSAGVLMRAWGATGREEGELLAPLDLAVGDGACFVADTGNSRVQRFSRRGEFERAFDGGGALFAPHAICADHRLVAVADTSGLHVFTTSGAPLARLSSIAMHPRGGRSEVRGLSIDERHRVLAADRGLHCLHVCELRLGCASV